MSDRVFLSWKEPALPQAADRLADGYARAGELPLDDVLVVVPGRRAGRRLTELLVGEAEARDLVLTPPRTPTIGALPELLYEPSSPLATSALSRRVWTEALVSLDRERRSEVFPDPPDDGDLHGWTRLAELVHGLHRETAREGLDFSGVARACREGEGFDDGSRWNLLSEVQKRYRRRLRELGYVDRDEARLRAVEDDRVGADREIVLVGVVEIPGIVRSMLRRAGVAVTPLVHAPEDLADAFDDLGCVRARTWSEREIEIPEEIVALRGRPPSQADEAVRRLSGSGRDLAPDEITVGVPNEEVVPYLEQRFRAYGIPHRRGAGTDLPLTGPYRLLAAVADYQDGQRFEDFSALLRHPEVSRATGVTGALEAADRHFSERLPARAPLRPEIAGERGDRRFEQVARSLDESLQLRRLAGRRPLSEWMPEVLALLRRVYGGREVDRTSSSGRSTVEALEVVRDAAAELHRLPEEVDVSCSGAAAIRVLLSEIRDASVPPLPDSTAVELLGWLELHLDDAPVLVITGFDEDHVPATVSADPFLPDGLRSRLGLVDNEWRHGRDAYLFAAILASREETHVVVGRRNADGDPLRPSRLLLAASGRELARRARRLFTDEVPSPAPLPRLGGRPAEESRFRTPPEPELEIDPPPESLGVTEFGLLLRDPYRWALEHRLGLEAVDDRRRELDGLQFGGLAHEVLRRFGESPAVRSADPERIRDRLHRELDEVAGDRYAGALPAVRVQIEQLRARLSDFAAWQADRVREGWETRAVEVGTPEGGVPLEVDGEPVGVRGRIDRVDRHRETGRWEVLDYKTSATAREPEKHHRKRGEWIDLQLPLYRHLLSGIAGEGALPAELADPGRRVDLGFVNLSRDGTDRAVASWSSEELERALEAARSVVRQLRSGKVRYREDADAPGGEALAPLLGEGRLRARRRSAERPEGKETA